MIDLMRMVKDGYRNLVANLSTDRDKAAYADYQPVPLTPVQCLNMYRSAWLPRKIVDIPADDATREWRCWNASTSQIDKLEAEEKRLGVRQKVWMGIKAARLFGGCVLLIGDGARDASKPLNPETIGLGGLKYLTRITPQQIAPMDLDRDPASDSYGLPSMYMLTGVTGNIVYVHPSRVVRLPGARIPDPWIVNTGWDDPILQHVLQAIEQHDGTMANIASMVFEGKVDVIHIPKLMEALRSQEGEELILKRLKLGSLAKGTNGTLILDGGGTDGSGAETYEQKQLTFSGVSNIIEDFKIQVCGAADITATRLFGQSASGMNSTGEGDERNNENHVKRIQELELGPAMHILDECLIRSALGRRPAEVYYNWRPLRQVTAVDRSTIFKNTADAARTLAGSSGGSLVPDLALSQSLANELTEQGVLPGLDQNIKANGGFDDPDDEEEEAALGGENNGNGEDDNEGDGNGEDDFTGS